MSFGVGSLKPIAIVLTAISHGECLALHLSIAYLLRSITYKLRATRCLLNRVFAVDNLLLLFVTV